MHPMIKACLGGLLSVCLLVQLGCGTVFYPERRGQRAGAIDIKIAVADGIGLLFFVIPGVIAYAVDFSTGAIYLPGGRRSSIAGEGVIVVRTDPNQLNDRTIAQAISAATGIAHPDVAHARSMRLHGTENLRTKLLAERQSCYRLL